MRWAVRPAPSSSTMSNGSVPNSGTLPISATDGMTLPRVAGVRAMRGNSAAAAAGSAIPMSGCSGAWRRASRTGSGWTPSSSVPCSSLSFVFTGTGVLFYLILAAIMPVAKTASDRLAMKGDPVTLESIIDSMESPIRARRSGQADRPWVQRWRHFVSHTGSLAGPRQGGALDPAHAIAILLVLVLGAFILSTALGFNGLF